MLQRAMPEFEVQVVADPQSALSTARRFRPDVFILDLVMPGITGTELAAQLRNDSEFEEIPIIFLSALVHSRADSDEPVSLNDFPAFGKPFSIEKLKQCIQQKLSSPAPDRDRRDRQKIRRRRLK